MTPWFTERKVQSAARGRGDAADRRADDRWHGVVDLAHLDRHPGNLRGDQGRGHPFAARNCGGSDMMDNMTNMMGGMGWGMGVISVLVILLLVLAVAALVRYLFFK